MANASIVYLRNETSSVHNPEGLAIEREYLYWTNVGDGVKYGAIHKGFTDPFIKAAPLQTYQVDDLDVSFSIAANGQYLIFSGLTWESTIDHQNMYW